MEAEVSLDADGLKGHRITGDTLKDEVPQSPAVDPQSASRAVRLTLDAPICKVVVFEDRAQVERTGALSLPAGTCRVVVPEVTPLLVERSLQVQASLPGVVVADCKLVRSVTRECTPVDAQAVHERLEGLEQESMALAHRLNRQEQRLRLLQARLHDLKVRWAGAVPRGILPQPFFQRMEKIEQELAEALLEKQRILWEQSDQVEEKASLKALIAASGQTKSCYSGRLELLLEVQTACTAQLSVRYLTACALWRPEHEARLLTRAGTNFLRLASRAVVWQKTGEAWKGVELYCSTARPGKASSPPLLQDDVLYAQKRSDPKTVVAEVRDEDIQTTGLGGGGAAASGMPGVDDGGEALSWPVEGRVDVPSTGRPIRAKLFGLEAEARLSLVSFPERAQQVLLRVQASNVSARPILAGPVLLYREAGYVGRSKVGFIAPGEKLALSFGSHDALLLQRDSVVKRDETRLMGYQTISVTVTHYISNLSSQPQAFEVTERIPVSELEDVRVSLGDGAPGKPDSDGLVVWKVQVRPNEQLTQTLTFRIEAPARVLLPF